MVQDPKSRLRQGYLPTIFTEALVTYESARGEVFGRRSPPAGRNRCPVIRWPQGWAYGQGKKRSQGGRVEGGEGRAVHGKARREHVLDLLGSKQINTSVVERHNGTSRLRHQRQGRKTLAFSKATRSHRWMSWRSVGRYNFCRAHRSLQISQESQVTHRSPAMAAGLTDHIWSTRQW